MSISSFEKFYKARERAKIKVNELIEDMRKQRWRDEHFAGKTLTEIARHEKCSDAHVGKCIMHSFDVLQAA